MVNDHKIVSKKNGSENHIGKHCIFNGRLASHIIFYYKNCRDILRQMARQDNCVESINKYLPYIDLNF